MQLCLYLIIQVKQHIYQTFVSQKSVSDSMLFKYFLKSPDFLKCKESCIDLPNRLALLLRCLQFQGHIYWGGKGAGEPSPTPIIFLILFCKNVTKLFLHFTFAAISICPGNKSWSIYELPPDCTLLFSLVFTLVLN